MSQIWLKGELLGVEGTTFRPVQLTLTRTVVTGPPECDFTEVAPAVAG